MEKLNAVVKNINTINSVKHEINKKLLPVMRDFTGKKIKKVDGTLTKKVKDAIYKVTNEIEAKYNHVSIFVSILVGSVYVEIKVWHHVDEYSVEYTNDSLYIGEVENGILKNVVDEITILENISLETIQRKIEEVNAFVHEARKQYEKMTKDIPFHIKDFMDRL